MTKVLLVRGKEFDHVNISTDAIIEEAKTIIEEEVTTEVVDNGILLTCKTEEGASKLLAKGTMKAGDQEFTLSKPSDGSVKLHVKNLDDSITKETLEELFKAHGTVKSADVKVDKEGKSKGFGQVIMSTQAEADAAIAALNDSKQGEKNISVAIAVKPEKTPKADKGKGDKKGSKGEKGKGKGEKGKGRGKGNQQANAQAYGSYPTMGAQAPPWMMPPTNMMNPYMMDPVAAQIMHQQMLTMQLYASFGAMATHAPDVAGAGGKGKGKGKQKDKGTKVDGKFKGKLKSINFREDKGYGFIDCAETKAMHGRDVYVTSDLVGKDAKAGDSFEFSCVVDSKGQLRATKVTKE